MASKLSIIPLRSVSSGCWAEWDYLGGLGALAGLGVRPLEPRVWEGTLLSTHGNMDTGPLVPLSRHTNAQAQEGGVCFETIKG